MPRHKDNCGIQGKATKWDHLKIIYGGQYQPPTSCDRDRMLSDQFKDFLTGKDSFHQKMKREARVRNEELDKTLKDLVQIFGYGTAGQKEAAKGTLSVLARASREMFTTD